MSKPLSLEKKINLIFDTYRHRPKGAKGHAAIKRDRKMALRKAGIK